MPKLPSAFIANLAISDGEHPQSDSGSAVVVALVVLVVVLVVVVLVVVVLVVEVLVVLEQGLLKRKRDIIRSKVTEPTVKFRARSEIQDSKLRPRFE